MNVHTETEWQFSARELDAARHWLAAQPSERSVRRFAREPTLELEDTYYDSPDWMIYRAGYALRLRSSRSDNAPAHTEVTLKSLNAAHGTLARRREYSQRVDSTDLGALMSRDDAIAERIRELIGVRALRPLFQARTRRERQRLLEADTELPLAEVDLDETSIHTPSGATQNVTRVEVECMHAEPGALEPWVASLRAAAQLEPVEGSKFRAGIRAAGLDPAARADLGPTNIVAEHPSAAAQLATLRRYFALVLESEPMVRAGSNAAVHEMRVAARHLEVLLRAYRESGPAWAVASADVVRDLVKALGGTRDCDVQLMHLDAASAKFDAEEKRTAHAVHERLQGERSRARAQMLRVLDAAPTRDFMAEWTLRLRSAAEPPAGAPQRTTAAMAESLILGAARKLRKRAERLTRASTADDYHEVRIRVKRLRYLLDAFESLYGDAARRYARALAKLQGVLGAFHDATVREARFGQLAANAKLPPATAFTLGRLVERDASAFERCRCKFPKAYRRIRRGRWRALRAAMRVVAEPGANLAAPA